MLFVAVSFFHSVPKMTFAKHCGQNIRLARDCCSAVRVNGFCEGLLLSERKIPNDCIFEVGKVCILIASEYSVLSAIH